MRTALGAMLLTSIGPRLIDFTRVPRSDQVLFVALAVGIGLLWSRYRKEGSPETKLRLAALAGLISVVLLSVASSMPWMEGLDGEVLKLGQEGGYARAMLDLDIVRWQGASTALSMGLVTVLALLLPALIWLLVEPRQRGAQAAAAVGASVAGFTMLAVLVYVESIPPRVIGELYWTSDLALLATSTIVVAAVLIVRQSFALLSDDQALPRAGARYRR
ncbi:MAG TPA: hypothetical protein VMZ28_19570 [Kofleriaceae bacterium]|nr:hypothetical protein [Kofleriaceae bacterium]